MKYYSISSLFNRFYLIDEETLTTRSDISVKYIIDTELHKTNSQYDINSNQ